MNPPNKHEAHEEQRAASTEAGPFGDEDHIEVLVEDLFIEEYPPPRPQSNEDKRGRLARATRPLKRRGKSLVFGLLALGAVALASLFFAPRRRRGSRISRMFHRLAFSS